MYGDLGKLGEFSTVNLSRPYRMVQEERFDSIDIGIRRVRVIGEQRAGLDQNLTEIHNTLASAEAICFLGFGFDETNFKLLKIDELLTETKPPQIFGSTKGLEAAEVTRVRDWCNGKIVDFSANLSTVNILDGKEAVFGQIS